MNDALSLMVVDSISLAAHSPNEDIFGFTSNSAWVLDGATSVDRNPATKADAAVLVQIADKRFRDVLTGTESTKQTLRGAVREASASVGRWLSSRNMTEETTPPSAAVTLVGLSDSHFSIFSLGDVSAHHIRDGSVVSFENERIRQREQASIRKYGGRLDTLQSVRSMQSTRRRKMNRTGGYWILSSEPESADHGREFQITAEAGDYILLASDGFDRCINVYGLYDSYSELFSDISQVGLERIATRIRDVERADPDCKMYPRPTPQDDATALLLKLVL